MKLIVFDLFCPVSCVMYTAIPITLKEKGLLQQQVEEETIQTISPDCATIEGLLYPFLSMISSYLSVTYLWEVNLCMIFWSLPR